MSLQHLQPVSHHWLKQLRHLRYIIARVHDQLRCDPKPRRLAKCAAKNRVWELGTHGLRILGKNRRCLPRISTVLEEPLNLRNFSSRPAIYCVNCGPSQAGVHLHSGNPTASRAVILDITSVIAEKIGTGVHSVCDDAGITSSSALTASACMSANCGPTWRVIGERTTLMWYGFVVTSGPSVKSSWRYCERRRQRVVPRIATVLESDLPIGIGGSRTALSRSPCSSLRPGACRWRR